MLAVLLAVTMVAPAWAADLELRSVATRFDPSQWEVRFGGFAHGVGGAENRTIDINGEFVVPVFPRGDGAWSFLIPRLHAGVNANMAGRTSLFYTGVLWTFPVTDKLFLEGFLDAAVHNGSLFGDATHAALGCRALVHAGGSIGYRIDNRWSVMLTYEHASNGEGIGLSTCPRNQGLNSYGARIGFSF